MARFMVVSLLLVGWGLFELSGGTDFTPPEIAEKPLNTLLEQVAAENEAVVARADTSPSTDEQGVTLAAFEQTSGALVTVLGEAARVVEPEAPAIPAAAPADLRQVSGNRVNMRNGPGTNYTVITQLLRGDEAEVLQEPGNGWAKIRVSSSGRVGWMSARFLRPVN